MEKQKNYAAAGFIGSLSSFVCVWPTEVLKYHFQMAKDPRSLRVMDIVRQNGLRGMYHGFVPAGMNIVSKETFTFLCYRSVSDILPAGMSGIVTGVASTVVTTPFLNMSLRKINYPGSSPLPFFVRHPLKLYSGVTTNFFKDTSRILVRFGVYDYTKEHLQSGLGVFASPVSGGLSNALVALVNNPIDVVMTRLQTNYAHETPERAGSIVKRLYNVHGIRGFYTGAGIRILRSVPGGMIMFGMYEMTLSCLSRE